ncbi:MAG TPA: RNA polymerase factor sigma-54 [Betaproteobacteria bacterium]|nr:RNA polymerase factor sigma-54 [Betaproteobacteria bacterium]
MKQSLQLKLSQQLTLTPQLQQSIRLLQLSTQELDQEVEGLIQQNPLLERGNAGDASDQPTAGDEAAGREETESAEIPSAAPTADEDGGWWGEAGGRGQHNGDDEFDYAQAAAESVTLRQHLNGQLGLVPLPERDKTIVALLIDALNDDGYLTMALEEIAALLPLDMEIEPIEWQTALKHLQNFDPAGVGARDLSECLALQLACLPPQTPYGKAALTLVRHHLKALAARDYAALKKALKCDDHDLREIQTLITRLNPRPGGNFNSEEPRYIIPDVTVSKIKDSWHASLNPEAVPKLRINRLYADILQRNRDASFRQLAGQLQEAKWLIKNIQQRFDTILRVSQAIIDRQRHFFEHGEVAMRPLVLREIAEAVGLHESTISRVTTHKYMLTPRGIYELKYFFGSHVATETGGACSATAIRALIKQMVGTENSKKPLTDSQITKILADQGIVVARRTIAKYRELLQIPPVNLRKSI